MIDYMSRYIRIASCVAVAILSATAVFGQTDFEKAIRENPGRAAGVHHSYEFVPSAETPAPKGYKPFYVSHYGRHGSRRNIGSAAELSYTYMSAARDAGILTPLGEELYQAVDAIHEDHVKMEGELTARGAREHRSIAERLYERTRPVWTDKARPMVNVQSSNIPRCLLSMANFTASLDDKAPQLRFTFDTGEKYLNLLAHNYFDQQAISAANSRLFDSLARVYVDPSRFMAAVFIDDPGRVSAVVPDPYEFMYQIYMYGSIRQCTETPDADIFGRFFTEDELTGWYRCYNSRIYNSMGNSEAFGDNVLWAARDLARDIISRADAALSEGSDVAADLRFGHDSGILPLAGLIDIIGPGDRVPSDKASDSWQSYVQIPMASNLQMVFYRKRGAEPLVKLYYNEREVLVRGLEPFSGPYYRWSELKAHLEGRIAQFEL